MMQFQWCVQVLVGNYSTEDKQYKEVLFCFVFSCQQIPPKKTKTTNGFVFLPRLYDFAASSVLLKM